MCRVDCVSWLYKDMVAPETLILSLFSLVCFVIRVWTCIIHAYDWWLRLKGGRAGRQASMRLMKLQENDGNGSRRLPPIQIYRCTRLGPRTFTRLGIPRAHDWQKHDIEAILALTGQEERIDSPIPYFQGAFNKQACIDIMAKPSF